MSPPTTGTSAAAEEYVLLDDGSLVLHLPAAYLPLARHWLPLLPYASRRARPDAARICIAGGAGGAAGTEPADLRLGTVSAWIRSDEVFMRGRHGCITQVDLAAGRALITPGVPGQAAPWEVHASITLTLALLLGRDGRALLHAAGPVAPDGRGWLLVGDARAGKTTTCVNLVRAGWSFASDDNVVLSRDAAGGLRFEGLPRRFHVDTGLGRGIPSGERGAEDPHANWTGRWIATAPAAGIFLPHVAAESPTRVERVSAGEALNGLIRQSPWLVADRVAAPAVLDLLKEVAALPAFTLRLGLDTFAAPSILAERLEPALAGGRSLRGAP